MTAIRELAPGIQWWTCPHPEYRTKSEEVVSYALTIADSRAPGEAPTPGKAPVAGETRTPGETPERDETLVFIDPLLPAEEDARRAPLLAALDDLVGAARRLEIMVTIPYHVRSAEELFERYWGAVATRVWGGAAVAKRFTWDTPLAEIPRGEAGTSVPIAGGLAAAFTIGSPRRLETPLFFPALKALAFGDTVVGMPDGSLRVWDQSSGTPTWYRDRFLPTLAPLAALDIEAVLVTHGAPVARGGRRALRAAFDTPPVTSYW